MRRFVIPSVDLLSEALATVAALLIRDNFETSIERLEGFAPYLLVTLIVAAPVNALLGISRTLWRFTTIADCQRVLAATVATTCGTVVISFWVNRLDGVARALPILQALLILFVLVGMRAALRVWCSARDRPTAPAVAPRCKGKTVLVVGVSTLTDLYLRSVAEFAPERVNIAGLLARHGRHTGRALNRHPILGTCEEVAEILRALEVHGVTVDRILVVDAFERLSAEAQGALLSVEKSMGIRLEFLTEQLGFEAPSRFAARGADWRPPSAEGAAAFSFPAADLAALARRPYWRVKRALDIVVALWLLVFLAPLTLVVAVLVALDVGMPVVFWQRRPGLGGRPFKLFKFRTMRAAHDAAGRRLADADRLSVIGRLLRRMRLDELPQLYHILVGEMSFVGPRPLLPADQPALYAARLIVRPGLTGWAQVKGGRLVSPADKAALDVWYLKNASLALDLKIILKTPPMLILGERANNAAVHRAWRELRQAGICSARDLASSKDVSVRDVSGARLTDGDVRP
ncbi:Sugar transferase involved in LPS biosynthesis (colanic, teichoic acid) [Rhizobiales bacterium GAS188]|nr:Sugar transferase involved in LPS biosynthesis (colanic, teichoic acid) [Rhizobiales bacterium GAS188]